VGASAVKSVVIDESGNLLGLDVRRSGHDFEASARASFDAALRAANLEPRDVVRIVSTGYGRRNIVFSDDTRTEIGCHAGGCFHYFSRAITVVDIGGQDNKVIKVDDRGRRVNFKMNRKCAAGTGAFLEEMANRLAVPLDGLDGLARSAGGEATLGSYCTVFSATEVLGKIRAGTPLADLVKGIFRSVVKRVMEMEPLTGTVVATGGVVAHNSGIVEILAEEIGRPVLVPPHPQCTGALGAALFARDSEE